jgi:hypothetical protein
MKAATAVDWTGNRDSTNVSARVDINIFADTNATPNQQLNGFVDWRHIVYNFRNSPNFQPGVHNNPFASADSELTYDEFAWIDNLPPPKPAGQFLMDGILDTSAVLLSSNGGINLYGRIKGAQLYVATSSAQSQGADMFIFVAVSPGSLQGAPWLKTGQVAGWLVFLGNESTNNSASWYDASSASLTSIAVDTAGAVLEGVIDLELLTGGDPATVYLAVGKYQTNDGGSLVAQVPSGNADANIDANEFYQFDTALPIQLASFTATPISNDRVRLTWTTASELNNYGFEVQRKRDGEVEFRTLPHSFVPGHGTTIEPHSYSFVDSTASVGTWWFRLKQIDFDGTIHFAPEVMVETATGVDGSSLPKVFALYQNYPNPFNPTTTLRYDVPRQSHVTLKVYNVLGQEVATLVNEQQVAGSYRIEWNATGFASGIYLCRLEAESFIGIRKMAVIK